MTNQSVWLMASYHMPSTYSIRVPVSSPLCGKALPTPGPATVQLAMIRNAIELYGLEVTRRDLFPHIVAHNPVIQPPEQVAISNQLQRLYKADDTGKLIESVGHREFCHCEGPIRVFMLSPSDLVGIFTAIFNMIGYWGQSTSIAICTDVRVAEPVPGRYAVKLPDLPVDKAIRHYFHNHATEIDGSDVDWTEIVQPDPLVRKARLRSHLYIWPLVTCEHHSTGQRLQFCSLL